MNWKFETYYIVTKGSPDGVILSGDTLLLRFQKCRDIDFKLVGEYEIFLPVHEGEGKTWHGLTQQCNVKYYNTKEELLEALKGVEVVYNIELVTEMIYELQKKIDKIRIKHEIIKAEDFIKTE
jgi:hypothetical protein